ERGSRRWRAQLCRRPRDHVHRFAVARWRVGRVLWQWRQSQRGAGRQPAHRPQPRRWFDFDAANLYRLDGEGWLAAWRTRTLDRLQAWGFNTLGDWSDPALAQKTHRLPYTRSINIAGTYANVASGLDYWGRMPDPFDPR